VDSTFELLAFTNLPGVGPRTLAALRTRAPLAEVHARPDDFAELLPAAAITRLRAGAAHRWAEAELGRAQRLGVRIIGRDEPDYPELLRQIFDPPAVLYVSGSLEAGEGARSVAVVGSRSATPAGAALARGLGRELARIGAIVVSGLARGIDTAAHRGVLDASGRTLAVLGSGLDVIYPSENAALAREITRGGAVISEFALGTPPAPGNFPRRNRVIAGCTRGVVVVEAALRSGALVTARLALEEGREVMAVPGHPSLPGAAGTNQLIRDGAVLVRDARDIALELGLAEPAPATEAAAPGSDPLLGALQDDAPASLEDLALRSGLAAPELLARLTQLELERQVRRLPGALFVRHRV
jgi:DNA processing protein